jgi:hypothetical protein
MATGRTSKSDEMSKRKIGETGIFYPEWFWEQGFRFADLLVMVKKGQTERVGNEIFEKYDNVLYISWRINAIANLGVQAFYEDSLQLKEMIEGIYAMNDVERVEFSEYVQVLHRRSYEDVEKSIKEITSE